MSSASCSSMRQRPPAPGAAPLPVHRPDADHADLLGEHTGPARAHQTDRVRPGQASRRPDLPAQPDPRSHPVHARRPRPRQSRHQPLNHGAEHAGRSGVTAAPSRFPCGQPAAPGGDGLHAAGRPGYRAPVRLTLAFWLETHTDTQAARPGRKGNRRAAPSAGPTCPSCGWGVASEFGQCSRLPAGKRD